MTIQQAARRLRAGETMSEKLTSRCLERIGELQPKLNAFITVLGESALVQAKQRDQELREGKDRGTLHGIPVAVKDVYCTKGVRTTCGSVLFSDHVPHHDAAVVERLAAAGAVLLGKTSMHELAYGITSTNPHFGAVRNPWNRDLIPGGSSGGSGAAVATGMAFMAMGSDTGGSIRIPASFCGVVGLKPTIGRVSRYGVMPLDFTLDHMGPLTVSVRDAALILNVLAGHDPRDDSSSRSPVPDFVPPSTASVRGMKVGLPESFFFDRLDSEVEGAVRRAAEMVADLGAEVRPVHLPEIEPVNTIARLILFAEASAVMEPYLGDRSKFGSDVLALLDHGRFVPATDYINAQRVRRLVTEEFNRVWDLVDCLMMPTTPTPAPAIGQRELHIGDHFEDTRIATTRMVRPFNVLGLPALSMPCGFTKSGLPVGLQLVGPAFHEADILRLGAVIEDAAGIHSRRPNI